MDHQCDGTNPKHDIPAGTKVFAEAYIHNMAWRSRYYCTEHLPQGVKLQAEVDRTVEAMANAIYAALNKQITFKSASKIFEAGKAKLEATV
jgi:hypothetical protein